MYDAVFSALMTLMGLSFAAIGLLLQAQEKHWVRHAHIWRSIRPNLIWSGVVISVSSSLTLVNMGSESNTTYSLTWWMVLFSFVVSLVFLGLLIRSAIENLEVASILARMRSHHFSDEASDISETKVKAFFTKVSQLLAATLDVGDLATFQQILDKAVVKIAAPEEMNGRNSQTAIRINNQAKIACGGLRELRAQIDFSMDNPITARAVASSCLVATKKIVDSWVDVVPGKHEDQEDAVTAAVAQQAVIEHAVEDFGYVAEFLLSVPRPSLSLAKEAAGICKSISLGAPEEEAEKSAERILNGAQRALSAGYSEEALTLLVAIRPWLNKSWKFVPTLLRLSVIDQNDSNDVGKYFSELFDELQADVKSLSTEEINLLAPLLVEVLSNLAGQAQSKLRASLYRLVSLVASTLNKTEKIEVFLKSIEGADDEIVQQFVQRFVLDNYDAPNFRVLLGEFFGNQVQSYGLGPAESVEKLCQLVYPIGKAVAKKNPERLSFFQWALVRACTNLETDVNPIYATLNAACAVEERDRLKLKPKSDNSKISYYPPNRPPKKTSTETDNSPRSQWNKRVGECCDVMRQSRDERLKQNLGPGFSSELRKRFLVNVAYLVIGLESEDPENQWGVLLDEKVIAACELALSWDLSDTGDVSAYLTWIRESAALVFTDAWPAGNNHEKLRKRWYQIFLLCTVALASMDKDLSTSNSSVEHPNWLELPNILDDLRENTEQLISERGANLQGGARIYTGTSYENFVKKLELVTATLAESRSENPEEVIAKTCETLAFTSPELKDEFCARLLTAVAEARLPEWAKETNGLSKKYANDGEVGGAYYLLRIVRSCLNKGGTVFRPEGLFYVVKEEGLPSKETPAWFDEVVETLARDWLAYKFNRANSEESKKNAQHIHGIKRRAREELRENIKKWSRSRN
jgi:hypothetical protein